MGASYGIMLLGLVLGANRARGLVVVILIDLLIGFLLPSRARFMLPASSSRSDRRDASCGCSTVSARSMAVVRAGVPVRRADGMDRARAERVAILATEGATG